MRRSPLLQLPLQRDEHRGLAASALHFFLSALVKMRTATVAPEPLAESSTRSPDGAAKSPKSKSSLGFANVVETRTSVQPLHEKVWGEDTDHLVADVGNFSASTDRAPSTSRMVRQDTMFTIKGSTDALKYVQTQRRVKGRPFYILHPHSHGVVGWDICTSTALIFTALVTPFEVSFMDSGDSFVLFVINRAIDSIFIMDMVLQFFIMQQVEMKKGADIESFWEYRQPVLARRYLKMWFWIDLFSVVPSLFDIIPVASGSISFTGEMADVSLVARAAVDEDEVGGNIKILRVIRTLRLAKLVRLLRTSRVMERWETRIAFPYTQFTVLTLFAGILYATHLFACVLAMTTSFGPKVHSWYGSFGYCDVTGFDIPLTPQDAELVPCADIAMLYLQSLYWALGIVLGFTNQPLRGPFDQAPDDTRSSDWRNDYHVHEEITFLILQFWGAIIWAYVTARLVDVIVNANPEATRFRQSIDELNRFCFFNKLPKSMEIRLREYYIKRKQITQAESRQQVAEGLSPMLQGEVAWHINAGWLGRIPFLNHDMVHSTRPDPEMQQLRVKVALALRPNVYAPGENPPDRHLYVIFNGLARYRGHTLTKGDHWGEWDVLLKSDLIRRRRAKAINYLHVLTINAETIESLAVAYPEAYRFIRRWVGWRSLSEFLLDKLRRRRRAMALLTKRWHRRYPNLFYKMRCFLWSLYLLLKNTRHDISHRGRLAMRTQPGHFNHHGSNALLYGRSDVEPAAGDDAARLEAVNSQMMTLLEEHTRLATRLTLARAGGSVVAGVRLSQAQPPAVKLPPMAQSPALPTRAQ